MLTHLRTLRAQLTRYWKAVALIALGALAGGTVLAVASVPDSNGMIHLCYTIEQPVNGGPAVPDIRGSNVTLIDPSAGQSCTSNQQALTIDQTGAQGIQGIQGASGTTGAQGPAGISLALPVKPTPIGQVTLKPPVKGKVGDSPANVTFEPVSVTISGRAPHASITIVKLLDTSSPTLLKALAKGSAFASGRIVMNATNGKQLAQYSLTDPVIENSEIDGVNNVNTQTLTLYFKSIAVQGA
jgi:Type VI secretion system effector, Hcp